MMSHIAPSASAYAPEPLVLAEPAKYSRAWWKDTADRTVSTAAQALIATLTVGGIAPNLLELNPVTLGGIAGGAALLAFLKALAVTRTG